MPAATTAPGYSSAEAQPVRSPEPSRLVKGLVPPPLIAVLALFADSRQVMRRYRSGRLSTVLVWFACLGMAAAALGLVISVLKP
jgi:Mn2+/Fe2+ NRAMP family transporter